MKLWKPLFVFVWVVLLLFNGCSTKDQVEEPSVATKPISNLDCSEKGRQVFDDSTREALVDSAASLAEKGSPSYVTIVNELDYRSYYLKGFDPALLQYSDTLLLVTKAMLDRAYFSGSSIRDIMDQVNDQKWFVAPTLSELIQVIYDERRVPIIELLKRTTNPMYMAVAEDVAHNTVMLIPDENLYGTRSTITGTFTANRESLEDWLDGGCCKSCSLASLSVFPKAFPRTRSGTLLQNDWVLTAGHNLKVGQTCIVIRNFLDTVSTSPVKFPNAQVEVGDIVFVEFGAARNPDFALVHLRHGFGGGFSLETTAAPISTGDSLFMSGHQLGMQMIGDPAGRVIDPPAANFSNYFFADLQVYSGTSGAPVMRYHLGANRILEKSLVGIVVGSGGLDDFYRVDRDITYAWNPRPKTSVVGARILYLNSDLRTRIQNIMMEEDSGDPNPNTISVKSDSLTFSMKNHRIYIHGDSIYVKSDENYDAILSLKYPLSVLMCGDSIHFWTNSTLEDNYDAGVLSRLPIHQESWPLDIMIPGDTLHHLVFKPKAGKDIVNQTPLPDGQTYMLLDGIGISDVVDELPDLGKYHRHFMWLCECEYIELKFFNMAYENGQKPAISIRTVKPFVPIYTRSEETKR